MSAAPPPSTGFLVLHGNRLEDLRDLTIQFLQAHPLPPLVPELFLVQSNGMKQWLEQALADDQALGICAATRIELPGSFLWEAYRAVLGAAAVPHALPFDKDALTWRLYRLLPGFAAADPAREPLRRYMGEPAGDAERHRFQLAQQIADVFDGYQQYRADWLAAWEAGDDDVAAEQRWQPALWRALQADVGAAHARSSRSAVHTAFEHRMRDWPADAARPAGLPPRIVVFGISALPLQTVRALAELGRICQVLVVAQNPSRHHWGHIVEDRELLKRLLRHRQQPRPGLDQHAEAPALLASWGRQGRDYLHLLDEFDVTESRPHLLPRTDLFTDPAADDVAPSRLARLQSAILNLEPPPSVPLDLPDDGSIQFVQAHSAQREVEVLHDRLLAWLDADPTLEPRDIMVMVPDMADFAAHIQAVFARHARGTPRHLPYSIADSSPRELPLAQALELLLHLPESRISLADCLALFDVAAVRRRFDVTTADVAALRVWLDAAGVRWGLDAAHRVAQGMPATLPEVERNSWAEGLRRLLLGYAQGDTTSWQEVLPVTGTGGLGAQRLGALAEWLDAIDATLAVLREPRPPADWVRELAALLDRFFSAADQADERLLHRLREQLDGWLAQCAIAQLVEPLPLAVVRDHWLARIETPGLAQRFFGGGVQFATLLPMRSIPFRIVCLLGMNDGDYPRRAQPRDFDLMAGDWRPGDRSRREDDRYLFLEALLSARQKLHVSWVGRRATDNTVQPPSVVVGQLRDEIARRFRPASDAVLQPLQPFSRRYFDAADPTFSTYDVDWQPPDLQRLPPRAAARAGTAVAVAARPPPDTLSLTALQRFLRRPVEVWWRTRLEVWLDAPEEAVREDEPFELGALEEHRATDEFIEVLQQEGEAAALQRLRLSGNLPLGAVGERALAALAANAHTVLRHAAPWFADSVPRGSPLALALDIDGVRIEGAVAALRSRQGGLLQLQLRPGALQHERGRRQLPRHHVLLDAWVVQVCLAAAGHPATTVICAADTTAQLAAPAQDAARRILAGWIDAWRHAWEQPLPVACRTACEYLLPVYGDDAARRDDAAREVFEGSRRHPGERDRSAYLARSFASFDDIAAGLARWAAPLYADLVAAADGAGGRDAEGASP